MSKKEPTYTLAQMNDWLNHPITKSFIEECNIIRKLQFNIIMEKEHKKESSCDSIALEVVHQQGIQHILKRLGSRDAIISFMNYYIKYPEFKEPENDD